MFNIFKKFIKNEEKEILQEQICVSSEEENQAEVLDTSENHEENIDTTEPQSIEALKEQEFVETKNL